MEYTFESLKKKTVAQLREIAKDIKHDAVQGYSQLNKEHLLAAICNALNIDQHQRHTVVGINKTEIKKRIRSLKKKRDDILESRDRSQLKLVLRKIHRLKRKIHKATV